MNKLIRYRYTFFNGTPEECINKLFVRFGYEIVFPESVEEVKKYLEIRFEPIELHVTISDFISLNDLYFKKRVIFGYGDVFQLLNEDEELIQNKQEKIIASTIGFDNIPILSKSFVKKFSEIGVGYCASIFSENKFLPDWAIQKNLDGRQASDKSLVGFVFFAKKNRDRIFVPLVEGWGEEDVRTDNSTSCEM